MALVRPPRASRHTRSRRNSGRLLLVVLFLLALTAAAGLNLAGPWLQDEGYAVPWLPPKIPYAIDMASAATIGQGELGCIRVMPTIRRDIQGVSGAPAGLRGIVELRFGRVGEAWVALVPVSYNNQPGVYPVVMTITDHRGKVHTETVEVTVQTRTFPSSSQYLQFGDEINDLRTEQKRAEDAAKQAAAKANPSPEPLWSGPFVQPVQGRVTTEFGHTRYINGAFVGRHSGIDWGGVGVGTPVAAAARGRVVLADALYTNGNSVMLDHGLGIFTSYNHLSAINVSAGDVVEQGQIVGLTGSTGVSTGPHLHYTMWVGEVATNPWPWFEADPAALLASTAPGE